MHRRGFIYAAMVKAPFGVILLSDSYLVGGLPTLDPAPRAGLMMLVVMINGRGLCIPLANFHVLVG